MEIIALLTILFSAHKDPVTRTILRNLKKMFNALLKEVEELKERAEKAEEKSKDTRDRYDNLCERYENLSDDYNCLKQENRELQRKRDDEVTKSQEKLDNKERDILDFLNQYVLCIINYVRKENFIQVIKVIRNHTEYRLKLTKDLMYKCCQIPSVPVVISKRLDALMELSRDLGNIGVETEIRELGLGSFVTGDFANAPVEAMDSVEPDWPY